MAVSESELALVLTARDNASVALQNLNKAIMGVKPAAEDTGDAVEKMSRGTVKDIGHMTHSAERIGTAFSSGSITGAVTGLFRLITTGMKSVEAEEAIMTMGITVAILAIVSIAEKIKSTWEGAEEALKQYDEIQKQFNDNNVAAIKASGDEQRAAYMELNNKRIADVNAAEEKFKNDSVGRMLALNAINQKFALDANALRQKASDELAKQQAEAEKLEVEAAKKASEDKLKIATKLKEQKHKDLVESQKDAEEDLKTEQELSAKHLKAQLEQAKDVAEFEKNKLELAKKGVEEQKRLAHEQEKAWEQANANQLMFAQGMLNAVGSAIAGSITAMFEQTKSFAEGMKDVLKTFVSDMISTLAAVISKLTVVFLLEQLTGIGEGVSAMSGGFSILGKLLEGVRGYATAPGQSHQVPGPYGMPQLAVVHGKEIISNPYGNNSGGGDVHLHISGDYFESEEANSRIFNRLYKYQKRNGLSIQPA